MEWTSFILQKDNGAGVGFRILIYLQYYCSHSLLIQKKKFIAYIHHYLK